jgi:hypothetical protein
MRKFVAAVATLGILSGVNAGWALADRPVTPSCHGHTNQLDNQNGLHPPALADGLGLDNAGEWNQVVKFLCSIV